MEDIEQTLKKTLESFPELNAGIQYEDKLTGISIIKEDSKKCTIYIGVLGKKFLEQANKEEITGVIAHEFGHKLAEIAGLAKQAYLSEQDELEDDMIADEKAAEKGYKEQVLAALKFTKKMYTDWTGSLEARIKNLEAQK